MNKQLTVLLSFLFFHCASAQDFAPIGAVWHYLNIQDMGPNRGYVKTESLKDTTIKGIVCRQIKSTRYNSPDNSSEAIGYSYVYTDEGIVYRLTNDTTFFVLYNFNAQVGDSWTVKSDANDYYGATEEALITVTNTSTVVINGKILRQLTVTTNNYLLGFGGTITETLGGMYYMFPQDYALSDMEVILGIRCYQDNDFGFYQTDSNTPCELLTTASQSATTESDIQFFPNPTSDMVNIVSTFQGQQQEVLIYTLEGQLIRQQEIDANAAPTTISLPHAGTYFVVLKIGDQKTVTRKITKL